MKLKNSTVSDAQFALIAALGQTIKEATTLAPMPIEDIVIALGFVTGLGIGRGANGRNTIRALKAVAEANVENGLNVARQDNFKSSLILPEHLVN
jgi:hypothetical protein